MDRNRVALAVLVSAGLLATGCGSDDSKPSSDSQPAAAQGQKTAKPSPKGARAQMVECIKNELGYDVTSKDDPDKLSVDNPKGKVEAVIVLHPNAGVARKAVAQTLNTGTNAVVFGRAEFIRHAADDTSAGVIANCVAIQYNRPRHR